jgi:hypothetical protein
VRRKPASEARVDKLAWVRELAALDEKSCLTSPEPDYDVRLAQGTIDFLGLLKSEFSKAVALFNQLRESQAGPIRIGRITGSDVDFMLFRDGRRMVFSRWDEGCVAVQFSFDNGAHADLFSARFGVYGRLEWHFQDQPVHVESLIRYYMSRFVQLSRAFQSNQGDVPR